MAGARVSGHPSLGEAGRSRDFLWRRSVRPLGLSRGYDLGVQEQTPAVPTTGQRLGLNLISAVSARGHLRCMVAKGKLNAACYVQFLKCLMHNSSRPTFLILDDHPVHKLRALRAYACSTKGKLRLFHLPSYSPELNPDEQVWNHVKHHDVGRTLLEGSAHLKRFVGTRLRRLQRSPLWFANSFSCQKLGTLHCNPLMSTYFWPD